MIEVSTAVYALVISFILMNLAIIGGAFRLGKLASAMENQQVYLTAIKNTISTMKEEMDREFAKNDEQHRAVLVHTTRLDTRLAHIERELYTRGSGSVTNAPFA